MSPARKIRVLIVDDSAMVRKILSETLAAESDIEVVGTAPDPVIAAEKIERLKPDVLTLDVEMPRMDGLTFLKKIMSTRPMPVIMISSITQKSSSAAIEAMSEGAVEVLAKPDGPYSVGEFRLSLGQKIRNAAGARPRRRTATPINVPAPPPAAKALATSADYSSGPVRLIAIGASTGGTEAIERIVRQLPPAMPPIVVVQHIPAGFSKAFAERLNKFCNVGVREAVNGDVASPGLALVAPGNFHMRLIRMGGRFRVSVSDGPMVCFQRPSVDVLFESIADQRIQGVLGVILTGMGSDGAAGMKQMKLAGARTIAQDEHSCVVFGMPREAIRAGGVDDVLPLDRIGQRLIAVCSERVSAVS